MIKNRDRWDENDLSSIAEYCTFSGVTASMSLDGKEAFNSWAKTISQTYPKEGTVRQLILKFLIIVNILFVEMKRYTITFMMLTCININCGQRLCQRLAVRFIKAFRSMYSYTHRAPCF